MLRIFALFRPPLLLSGFILHSMAIAWADNPDDPYPLISREFALGCIQLNLDLDQASEHMRQTETDRAELKARILYLKNEIRRRRDLIEELDQRSTQENNDNYNRLVDQYEELTEEHNQAVHDYNQQQNLFASQYNRVSELQQRFTSRCLQQMQMSEALYRDICESGDSRWCRAFHFSPGDASAEMAKNSLESTTGYQ